MKTLTPDWHIYTTVIALFGTWLIARGLNNIRRGAWYQLRQKTFQRRAHREWNYCPKDIGKTTDECTMCDCHEADRVTCARCGHCHKCHNDPDRRWRGAPQNRATQPGEDR